MAMQAFRTVRFRPDSLARIDQCNEIIVSYQAQNLRLTLRQLYYQLVSRNIIANSERSYQNLSSLVSDARLSGLMDWDAIEDRVRQPKKKADWDSISDLVDAACSQFRKPRWNGQEHYVELWVEKDALAGVLWPIAAECHVTMMVNRGYSSQSAMYEAANRFNEEGDGRDKILLYLGDHDPSGEDMVRDIAERLEMFGVSLDVRKIALTMDQIKKYRPPPNPAKVSDPRATAYIQKFGDSSWEVDALPPEVLSQIIRTNLAKYCDQDLMDEIIASEESDKKRLRKLVSGWK